MAFALFHLGEQFISDRWHSFRSRQSASGDEKSMSGAPLNALFVDIKIRIEALLRRLCSIALAVRDFERSAEEKEDERRKCDDGEP